MANLNSLSSDPFVLAQLNTSLPMRHKQDPHLRFRTPTIRKSVDPDWNSEWIVANVPDSGFELKARIYDEDPSFHDDRLGDVRVYAHHISEEWEGIKKQSFKIKKRLGNKKAYLIKGCASMFNGNVHISGELIVSAEVLGRTKTDNGGRVWTVGPCAWSQHFSPLIGRLTGTKDNENGVGKYKYAFSKKLFSQAALILPLLIVSKQIKSSLRDLFHHSCIIAMLSLDLLSLVCLPIVLCAAAS